MAKKEKLKIDNFNLDDDLDFDFNLDDIDKAMSAEARNKKSRTPVMDVFKGAIGGTKGKFKDPRFLADLVKKSLPKEYGEVFSAADQASTALSSLYDEAIREIKPQLGRLSTKVDRLVPEEKRHLKKLTDRIKQIVGEEPSTFKKESREERQEKTITDSLASLFEMQAKADAERGARESADDKIKQSIEHKRFQSNFGLLSSINTQISRLSTYNDKVTQAYQKKSLELQFRSYFVQNELLETSKQFFEIFKNQHEAIARNTALPEYVKIKNSERFKELAKTRFIGNIQQGLYDNTLKRGIDNLKKEAQKAIQGFKSGLYLANEMATGIGDLQEQQRPMADLGMEPTSKYELLGSLLGSQLSDYLKDKIGSSVRNRISDRSKIGRFGYKLAGRLSNLEGSLNEARQSDLVGGRYMNSGLKGFAGMLAALGLDVIGTNRPNMRIEGSGGLGSLNEPSIYGGSKKAEKSLTDIIPGYLSRIYRELIVTRTKNESTPLTIFDHRTDKFITQTKMTADIKSVLSQKIKTSGYSKRIDEATQHLIGNETLSEVDRERVKKFISKLSYMDIDYNPETIKHTTAFRDSGATDVLSRLLDQRITSSGNAEKGQYDLTQRMMGIKKSTPDLRSEIELFIRSGYGEILEDQGLVNQASDGSYTINFERYKDLLASQSSIVSSDRYVKRNIKPVDPKEALASIKKTKIYDWFYKLGKGDKKPHVGPMAQDVRDHMGEETAPDGTKIDLTSMNGINMAAIKGLQEQQEQSEKGNGVKSILMEIKKDTSSIVELLERGQGFSQALLSISIPGFKWNKEAVDKMAKDVKDKAGKAANVVGQGAKKSSKAGYEFVSEFYKNHKDTAKTLLSSLFIKGTEIAGSIMDTSRDILMNKLPQGFKQLVDFGKTVTTKITDWLDEPMDVFVRGRSTPAIRASLLRMGRYVDQQTGKVIKNLSDIKGPVITFINGKPEVVLSEEDFANGLHDSTGVDIKTPFTRILNNGIAKGMAAFGQLKNAGKTLLTGAMHFGSQLIKDFKIPTVGLFDPRSHSVLVEIRDILKARFGSPYGLGNVDHSESVEGLTSAEEGSSSSTRSAGSTQVGSIISGGKGLFTKLKKGMADAKSTSGVRGKMGALFGSLFAGASDGSDSEAPKGSSKDNADELKVVQDIISGKAKKFNPKAATWNDQDGSGRRDGDWRDRLEAMAARSKEKAGRFSKPDLDPKYMNGGALGGLLGQAKALFGLLSGGVGGLLSKAKSIFQTVAGFLGFGGGGGVLGGLGKAAKGVFGAGKAVLGGVTGAARAVGTPILRGLSAVRGMAGVSSVLSAGNTVRNILTIGSLASTGASAAVLGTLSAGMTAIAAVLSSPVVIGAAAVAAAGYGAYRAYKYFTQDKTDDYQDIRIKQYGLLNTDGDKHHNHELLQLEEYLLDGRLTYEGGKARINDKKISTEEMLNIFSIDKEDQEMVQRYSEWFVRRFSPFFLTHVTALFSINNKIKLNQLKELTDEEKIRYLSLISFESGPYYVDVSPFKDVEALNTHMETATNAIKFQINQLQEKIKTTGYQQKKVDASKEKAANYTTKAKSTLTPPPPSTLPKTNIGVQKGGLQTVALNQGEDGVNKQLSQGSSAISGVIGKSQTLYQAEGPMRDGSSGMGFIRLERGVSLEGVNPALLNNFKAMAQEYGELTGKSILVTSGYRSSAQQEALYRKDPSNAARPGRSLHEFGLAVDVNSADLNQLDKMGLMRKYGFTRPVGGEPWHMEPAGLQGQIDDAKINPLLAEQLISASLFKGGGGVGSIVGSPKGKRDSGYAISLWDGSTNTVKSDKDKVMDRLASVTVPAEASNEASYSRTSFSSSTSSQATSSFSNSVVPFPTNGGYAGSVENTKTQSNYNPSFANQQSDRYSKNDQLFEVEGKPVTGGTTPLEGKPIRNKGDVIKTIHEAAKKVGTDPNVMTAFAAVESSLNPYAKAKTSSAAGLFQFTNATWNEQVQKHGRKHKLNSGIQPTDPMASSLLASEYVKSNTAYLRSVKSNLNLTDVYLTHFLGPGGAKKLLSANPDTPAANVLPDAAKANKSLFFANGRPLTVREFYSNISEKLARTAQKYNVNLPVESLEGRTDEFPPKPGLETMSGSEGSRYTNAGQSGQQPESDFGGMQIASAGRPSSTPTSTAPTTLFSNNTAPVDSGPGFSSDAFSQGLNHVGETLDKSLLVQQGILDVLKQILTNVNPENFQDIRNNLMNVANQSKSTQAVPPTAIDLSRKSA